MKNLDRSLTTTPICLSSYSYPQHQWKDVTSPEKKTIWQELDKMQLGFCAYCQRKLTNAKHIEHFYPRNQFQQRFRNLTFNWNNFFGSCGDKNTCGQHKDNVIEDGRYNPQLLLKPDTDNPEGLTHYYASGTIAPRNSISQNDKDRVNETIRVFNLNNTLLEQLREKAISSYLDMADQINNELISCENYPDLIQICVKDADNVLLSAEGLEFSNIIKATFKTRLGISL